MSRNRFPGRLALILLAAFALIVVWQQGPEIARILVGEHAEPRVITPRGDLAANEQTIIKLFEASRQSVVYISTSESVTNPWTQRTRQTRRGTGSGFVWDDAGHIVTNNHVVEGASRATVRLADGHSYNARLVGTAPSQDLAVLKIDAGFNLPDPLPIGRSKDLQVGQAVLAIGNPFGLDWTLTTGIVSALDRRIPEKGHRLISGLIQTDAAINPGNSGGPLLDSAGRLIGMNTAIFSPSGASAGIGFAIPVATINRVVPKLIAQGRYTPPSLGVEYDPRVNAAAERAGIKGVVVLGVKPGSPAANAGLKPARVSGDGQLVPGDVIVGVGDDDIVSVDDLVAALDNFASGDSVEVTLERDGETRQVSMTLT